MAAAFRFRRRDPVASPAVLEETAPVMYDAQGLFQASQFEESIVACQSDARTMAQVLYQAVEAKERLLCAS